MKRITITVDTNEHATELEGLLNKLPYVISVEEDTNDSLSSQEESFVNDRVEYYGKNKDKALSLEEFTAILKSRYGI